VSALAQRVRRGVQNHGVRGVAQLALGKAQPVRAHSAAYVWYALDLRSEDRPRRELSGGLTLRAAGHDDVALLEQLPSDGAVTPIDSAGAHRRLDEGANLWLVTEDDRLAFACWTFPDSAPVWAARGTAVPLPHDVVCLEDSHSSPDFRGRGVAPAAWSAIADRLAEEGNRTLVTKIGEGNAASRRAVEKVGFREVATMRMGQRGWTKRVKVQLPAGSEHDWLASADRG
jgi:RimJ/RimL family protein N-acetyltransferase